MNIKLLKISLSLFTLGLVPCSLHAGTVKDASEIEKELGLDRQPSSPSDAVTGAPAGAAPGVRTRGVTRGVPTTAPPGGSPKAASAPVVRRSAVASQATLDSVRTRGVSVEIVSEREKTVAVPVVENVQAMFNNILFEKDSTRLADAASGWQIEKLAQVMRAHPERKFVVEGHTCDLGSDPHNQRLSVDRAAAIESRLLRDGVRREQIVALGFGETDPVATVSPGAPATDPAAETERQKNRRVVIRLQASNPSWNAR